MAVRFYARGHLGAYGRLWEYNIRRVYHDGFPTTRPSGTGKVDARQGELALGPNARLKAARTRSALVAIFRLNWPN